MLQLQSITAVKWSRQFYDLNRMLNAGIAQEAIAATDLFTTFVRHREWYIRVSWLDYKTLAASTLNFIPPDDMIESYSKDYEAMREQMIYGEADGFDDLIIKLREFLSALRKKILYLL